MKTKLKKRDKKTNTTVLRNGITMGVVTSVLTGAFLSGKMINIPKGTQEGGIISAIGVGVILVFMMILGFILTKISHHKSKGDK